MTAPRLKPNEGRNVPVSFRMGEALLARVKAIAKSSGSSKTDVMVEFIRWACQTYEDEGKQSPERRAEQRSQFRRRDDPKPK